MRYLIYDIDKHQDDCQLTENPTKADFENADDSMTVIVDLEQGQKYFAGQWNGCLVRCEGSTPDEVRGWVEKGTTWQARACHAEKRLAEAYARARHLDEEITRLKMEIADKEERHKLEMIHLASHS